MRSVEKIQEGVTSSHCREREQYEQSTEPQAREHPATFCPQAGGSRECESSRREENNEGGK